MNYQNSVRYGAQSTLNRKFRQQLRGRKVGGLPGGSALWLAASKIALGIVLVGFCFHLWLNFSVSRGERTIQSIEAGQHQLREEQITLLAMRASLMSEKQVIKRAGAELALFVPDEDQVFKLR
jgi:hypothetical protein